MNLSKQSMVFPRDWSAPTTPLSNIISRHNVCHHLYADIHADLYSGSISHCQNQKLIVIVTVAGLSVGSR